jgi:hypothetical protein
MFLFSLAFLPVLRSTQPPTQWVSKTVSLALKRKGREGYRSPPSRAEVKNGVATPPLPSTSLCHGAELIKPRSHFAILRATRKAAGFKNKISYWLFNINDKVLAE